MHFLAIALLPRDTSDVWSAVERLMEPYYVENEGPTRKEYLDGQAIRNVASQWLFPIRDPRKIAARLNRQFHLDYQVDDGGIYFIANDNLNGKYDYWTLHNETQDVWPVSVMPRDLLPAAVVIADEDWHDIGIGKWDWDLTPADKQRIQRDAYTLIDQYPNHLAVRLDCHI